MNIILGTAGALLVSIAALGAIAVLVYRETARLRAFDRRLDIARRNIVRAKLWSEQRERTSKTGDGNEAKGLALVRTLSIIAPVSAKDRAELTVNLRACGFGKRDALAVYLCIKTACAVAFGAATMFAATAIEGGGLILGFAIATIGFVGGGLAPDMALRQALRSRNRRMASAFPDALDLLVMALESGLTFERAMLIVSEEMQPIEGALSRELRMIEAELRLGGDRRTVLRSIQDRTTVRGLRDMATALLRAERYGTPLAQSMRNIAAGERVQRMATLETRAGRLPVLMTLPMMLLVVPGTLCLIAGPGFVSAIKSMGAAFGG